MIPEAVRIWLAGQGFGEVVASRGVGGGCINNGARLETSSGTRFFLKTNHSILGDMFAREVDGLTALAVADGPRVPKPYLHGADFLLMEDLAPSGRAQDYWKTFGRQMAALHDHTNPQFGFTAGNFIGSTPQPNDWTADGFQFFSEQRLGYQAQLAGRRGLLSGHEVDRIARLAGRLKDLVPEQPASLLHGDLWSGNAIADERGQPAIIDPAVYYGWAEADLAMTALFGGFSGEFYTAYTEVRPLPEGWRERFSLYNLYHLLNHLNLFGSGYYGQVIQTLNRWE